MLLVRGKDRIFIRPLDLRHVEHFWLGALDAPLWRFSFLHSLRLNRTNQVMLFIRAELHLFARLPIIDLVLAIIISCWDKVALVKEGKTTSDPDILFLFLINLEGFHSSIYTFLWDIRSVHEHIVKQQAFSLLRIYKLLFFIIWRVENILLRLRARVEIKI